MQQQQDLQDSKVVYGNPNQYDLHLINQKNYLDSILSNLDDFAPYDNDSEEVKNELNEIISAINSVKDNNEILMRYSLYDADLTQYIINTLSAQIPLEKENIEQLVSDLQHDVIPLITKLKYKYQRPRPYQLAHAKKMFLYPIETLFAHSPSYPSHHAFVGRIICEVLGNKYPKYYKQLRDLATDIALSRFNLGVNYRSDISAAYTLSEKVLKNIEFIKKYRV